MKKFLKPIFFILTIYISMTNIGHSALSQPIKSIKINGLERIEEITVKAYINFREGEIVNDIQIDESLKKLYATGFFSNINIENNNSNIEINLIENPIIHQVAFEGNKSIKTEDIKQLLILKPRSIFNKVKLLNDIEKINDLYIKSGRFSTIVTPAIIELPQNRIDLVFEVKESKKAPIKKILFVGNTNFRDSKLNSIISSKESRWYSFLSSSDNYDPYKLEHDKEILRRFYNSKGFADFKIISANADLIKEQNKFIITFSFEEGNKYKFGKIEFENNLPNSDLNIDKLKHLLLSKENSTYNYDEIEDSIDLLTKHINDMGIAFVNIEPDFNQDNKNNIIGIKYIISEGKKIYLNKINISGNIKTIDKVIRREFRIAEGDPYNASQISRSEQRIRNLDFFDKVEFNNIPTEFPDKYDIDINVVEKSTSKINIGGGYSGTDKILGQFSIVEDNFLGKGQQVNFGLTKASKRLDLDIGFTEPYLFNKNISSGFDLYKSTNDKTDISPYKNLTSGFTIRTGYEISEYLNHSQRYSVKKDKITNIDPSASIYIQDQKGKYSTSSIGHTLFYDKIDSKIDPTKGYSIRFDQELAGIGGKAKFIREELNFKYFKPIIKKDFISQFNLNFGHITPYGKKIVRISDRFFIGDVGPYGLRGFAPGGIGPRAYDENHISHKGDPLGGNIYYTGSLSLNFPIGLPEELDVSGSLFTDFGSLFKVDLNKNISAGTTKQDRSIRSSVGAGFVWITKLGPIRLDFPVALLYKKYDRRQHFHINFSTNF